MITSIKFDEKIFEGYSMFKKDENLDNLNRINVFIGKNNSGKSRFLRRLLKNKFEVETQDFDSETFNNSLKDFKETVRKYLYEYEGQNNTLQHLSEGVKQLAELAYVKDISPISSLKNSIENLSKNLTGLPLTHYSVDAIRILDRYKYSISSHKDRLTNYLNQFNEEELNFSKIYIPILRGLRPLQIKAGEKDDFELLEDNYLKRSKSDYKIDIGEKIKVHTGLDLYQQVTKLLLGKHSERLKIKKFEEYLSTTFFQGDDVHIIPMIDSDVLHIKIRKAEDYPIYELGEGVQAIILLTYPLFFNEGKKMLFFIEEPELHLHPGLERVLIETMRERFSTFQYFITTHSNHILDLTLEYDDISIYSFQKKVSETKNSFSIQNVSSDHKQVLDLLGVRNSSVFLANCTIWVEGITDRLYLRKYLELLQKERNISFKEDYHYAFIEYAGSNITHWSFLESDDEEFANINIEGICSKVFLIVDNDGVELPDGKKKKKQERQEQLRQKLGANFYITEGREIENLLSKKIVKQVIESEKARDSTLDFTAFDKKDYSKSYIGDFIDKNVIGLKKKYSSEYGTIKDKVGFCKKAISQIESVEDLSEKAKKLGNLILDFIQANNSKSY